MNQSDRARAGPFTMAGVLAHIQLARLRRSWRPYVIVSAVMPAGIVLLLVLVTAREPSERQALLPVVLGAMLLAEAISALSMLAQQAAWLRHSGALDQYRVLPVSLPLMLSVMALSYGAFGWPGMLLVWWEGHALAGVPALPLGESFLLAVLEAWALGGIGAVIGLAVSEEGLAGLFGNLAMMAVLFGSIGQRYLPARFAPVLGILPSTWGMDIMQALAHHRPTVLGWWLLLAAYGLGTQGIAARLATRSR
jgi:hypothetical protein